MPPALVTAATPRLALLLRTLQAVLTRELGAGSDVHLSRVRSVSRRARVRTAAARTPARNMGCLILNMSVSGVRMTAMVGECVEDEDRRVRGEERTEERTRRDAGQAD
jgi:hypothetical protein